MRGSAVEAWDRDGKMEKLLCGGRRGVSRCCCRFLLTANTGVGSGTDGELREGTDQNGAKLRHFWDGFGVGFFTGSGSGFEKDFLANGTHFFEDGFELLVGSDSLFQKVGLFLRE